MSALSSIPAGNKIPHEINVLIEIPAGGGAIKYEVDKDSGLLMVDRFMPTSMRYPCNYGFVPNTLADDGDPLDVLVITPEPLAPGSLVAARAIGMLNMTDESGEDTKVLAVPTVKSCAQYAHISSLDDIEPIRLKAIEHFFSHYKELEPNKWVKLGDWDNADAAHRAIEASVKAYQPEGS